MNGITDVIAAVSTPPGKGGVAVIRICGRGTAELLDKLFLTPSGKTLSNLPPRRQVYGFVYDGTEPIDDVMATRFEAPSSYTGEDTVEIYCHGGTLVTRSVLEAIFRCGVRPAEAGEFTKRAFINGKITLSDAELISTLLEAKSREEITLSGKAARERLNREIDGIKKQLTELMSSVWARIDYPDEDLGDFTDKELLEALDNCTEELDKLISTYRTGRAISEGISTVLCGKPNVGKSSIYNAILGEDAAIVTDVAGTTRDVLERTTALGRVTLKLRDTAGIRTDKLDPIERIGIERSQKMIKDAELILAVFDISEPLDEADREIIREIAESSAVKVAILNKFDKNTHFSSDSFPYKDEFSQTLTVSANDEATLISTLTKTVNQLMTDEKISASDTAIVSSARQHAQLLRTRDFLNLARNGLALGFSQDTASSDIERALASISGSDAREVSESVVTDIFSKFCVGK